ncbi:MAG: hypothetical protein H6752_16380 [Candidatus Omnitrophica bacterium]|nr:hypothetical protein [Candidatus Omnitrophota bacterium]
MGGETESSLKGKRIGVTAGPTRAWIDPVRYLANASSGVLGCRISESLVRRGAEVDLIMGKGGAHPTDPSVGFHSIQTIEDLQSQLKVLSDERARPFFAWIHAMAVLDFVPESPSEAKIPSDRDEFSLPLRKTPKIIEQFRSLFPHSMLVGFKLETTEDPDILRQSAQSMGDKTDCDLVIANSSPFQNPERHQAYLLDPREKSWEGPFQGKSAIAEALVDWLEMKATADVRP